MDRKKRVLGYITKEHEICAVPQCDNNVQARGFCAGHYDRNRRDTLWSDLIGYEYICEMGESHKTIKSCKCKRKRDKRYDNVPSYHAQHVRLRKFRGKASNYDCVEPATEPHKAQEWALRPGRGKYLGTSGGHPSWYSDDLDDYQPMCKSHHKIMDWKTKKNG